MASIGELIAERYRLEKLLGEGGMGAVYQAVNEKIGKRVAIKFLRSDGSRTPTDVERFRREARAAAAAGHRNIVEIYDLDVDADGAQYLVMELLEGQSLGEQIGPDRTLDEARIAYVACQVLSALDAAHAAGIVHRDLKPDNLFLVEVGAPLPDVKLLDFGVSHMQDLASSIEADQLRLTKTGTIIGSPLYMSPEQALGESDIDARTDVYAMGVILYEAVTGRVPHLASNYQKLLAAIVTKEASPPSLYRPELSAPFEAVILRALRKEREERFASAAEMFEALLPFVSPGAVDRICRPRSRGPRSDQSAQPPVPAPRPEGDISLDETVASSERPPAAGADTGADTRAPASPSRPIPPTRVELRPAAPEAAELASARPTRPPAPARRRAAVFLVLSAVAAGAVGSAVALSSPGRATDRPAAASAESPGARSADAAADREAPDASLAELAPGRSAADARATELAPVDSARARDAGRTGAGSGGAGAGGLARRVVPVQKSVRSPSPDRQAADDGGQRIHPGAATFVRDSTSGGARIVSD